MAREPDSTTDTENAPKAGNPQMGVGRDAKPQRVLTGGMWTDAPEVKAGLDGKDQAQNGL